MTNVKWSNQKTEEPKNEETEESKDENF